MATTLAESIRATAGVGADGLVLCASMAKNKWREYMKIGVRRTWKAANSQVEGNGTSLDDMGTVGVRAKLRYREFGQEAGLRQDCWPIGAASPHLAGVLFRNG